MKNTHRINGLIYITSDVDVLDGEYGACLSLIREGLSANLAIFKMDKEQRRAMEELGGRKKAEVVKLILSNDPTLTADGIQAIEPDALNWLNDNPSCEGVEIENQSRCCGRCNGVNDLCYADSICEAHNELGCEICFGKKIYYKINLPKNQTIEDRSNHSISLNEVSETKTIEEAAENYVDNFSFGIAHPKRVCKKAFVNGAKSQAAKDYWYNIFKSEQQC